MTSAKRTAQIVRGQRTKPQARLESGVRRKRKIPATASESWVTTREEFRSRFASSQLRVTLTGTALESAWTKVVPELRAATALPVHPETRTDCSPKEMTSAKRTAQIVRGQRTKPQARLESGVRRKRKIPATASESWVTTREEFRSRFASSQLRVTLTEALDFRAATLRAPEETNTSRWPRVCWGQPQRDPLSNDQTPDLESLELP